mgnify:CR=1 FL=1
MKYLSLLLLLLLVIPISVEAGIELNLDYPALPGGIDLNDSKNQDITSLIGWVYTFIIAGSGLAAFVMIVWGGLQWMSSSGDTGMISTAKDRIKKALLGLLVILTSFILLNLINPELTALQIPTP